VSQQLHRVGLLIHIGKCPLGQVQKMLKGKGQSFICNGPGAFALPNVRNEVENTIPERKLK
jgi:hypothetical protein